MASGGNSRKGVNEEIPDFYLGFNWPESLGDGTGLSDGTPLVLRDCEGVVSGWYLSDDGIPVGGQFEISLRDERAVLFSTA